MNREVKFQIQSEESYDVVVCGSGPSGMAAAIQIARNGLSVALIEREGCFGGNMTTGGVCHLLGGRRWNPEVEKMDREVGGLFDEITDALIKEGNAVDPDSIDVYHNPFGWYPRMAAGIACNIEALKRKLDKIVVESNIHPYLFTTIIGTETKENIIESIYVCDQDGIKSIHAKTFVDATGDAQVAFLSGCPTFKGRDEDNLMTPATLIAHVDNVDTHKYVEYQNANSSPKLIEIINSLRDKGIWKFPFEIFISIQLNEKDVCMLNTVRQVGVDGTNAKSLTAGMIDGRKETEELLKIMQKYFPGFENARLRMIAPRIGIRESRRIDGRAYVTYEDAKSGKEYLDQVVRTTYNFDLPDPLRPSYDPLLGSVAHPDATRKHKSINAPYGCLLPKTIDNLVVCGRCISVSREVLGPMRVTGPAMMSGQAAGIAAILAYRNNTNVASVNGCQIHAELVNSGCII